MNKLIFPKGNQMTKYLVKHMPELLTGAGIAGMIFTVVEAVKATPKALKAIEVLKEEVPEPKPAQTVKAAWKCYVPAAITGTASICCIIFANRESAKRNAALAAAYAISESTFSEYKAKVLEKFGKKKETEVRDAIVIDKMKKDPITNKEVILTGLGEHLCYDATSGRYFKSDIECLRKAENQLNLRLREEMFVSLNEFYAELGLMPIDVGDLLGWNIDKGYIELQFTSHLSEENVPCLAISCNVAPYYNYI